MGLASPKNIGIVAATALAAGLVPGVPGLVEGAPGEDAAGALPPATEIVDVVTTDPVGPDDGLIRLIVTPTAPASAQEAAPTASGNDASTEPDAAADPDAVTDDAVDRLDGPDPAESAVPAAEARHCVGIGGDDRDRYHAIDPSVL